MLLNIPQGTGCPNKEGCGPIVSSAEVEKLCSTVKTVMLEKVLHCAFFVTNKSHGSTYISLCQVGGKVGLWLHKYEYRPTANGMGFGFDCVFQETLGTPQKKPMKKESWH